MTTHSSSRLAGLAANGLDAWAQAVTAGYEGAWWRRTKRHSIKAGGRSPGKLKQRDYREGERGWEPIGKT
jgi:hypothetical protein